MKTPSTLTLTVNAKETARLAGHTCPEIGLQMLYLEHEAIVARLLLEVHVGKTTYNAPKPKHCQGFTLSVRYLGKCQQGRLVELRTLAFDGDKVAAFGCLVDELGNVAPLSYIEEAYNADSITAVRYDRRGEIASIDLPTQAALTKKCTNWLAKALRRYDIEPLHTREYRTDWHDNSPATLQAPETKASLRKAS